MRVLLVQAYLGVPHMFVTYPLGLAYVGTMISSHGHEVRICDPNVEDQPLEALERAINEFQPALVGVSLRNIDDQNRLSPFYYYQYFQRTIMAVRRLLPDVPLVAGGSGFSMFAERIMERNPAIDLGVYLEGENSFPELLDHLDDPSGVSGIYFRSGAQVEFSGECPFPDFANLPYPRRDLIDLSLYRRFPFSVGVQTKRGCPLHCGYCNYPALNGRKWRLRTPEHIADELEYMAGLGVEQFAFCDSILNVPYEHSVQILEKIIDRGIALQWTAYLHLKKITREYVALAKRAGCSDMVFSPDGYSQAGLDGLTKGLTEDDIRQSVVLFNREREFDDMTIVYCLFSNPPGETVLGLLRTWWFFLRMKFQRRPRRFLMNISWIRIEPHTKVFEQAVEEGIIDPGFDLLPEDGSNLKRAFYRGSTAAAVDNLIFGLRTLVGGLKRTIFRLLGRRPVPPRPIG